MGLAKKNHSEVDFPISSGVSISAILHLSGEELGFFNSIAGLLIYSFPPPMSQFDY